MEVSDVPTCRWAMCPRESVFKITWMNSKELCFCAEHTLANLDKCGLAWIRRVDRI